MDQKIKIKIPKIDKEKEVQRFFELCGEYDQIENIRKSMDGLTYLLPKERKKIENILFENQIRILRNLEWQRKIAGIPSSLVGDVEEYIRLVKDLKKKVMKRIKEGKMKTDELFEDNSDDE